MSDSRVLDVDPNQMSQEELAEIGRRAIYELNLREAGRKFRETREAGQGSDHEEGGSGMSEIRVTLRVEIVEQRGESIFQRTQLADATSDNPLFFADYAKLALESVTPDVFESIEAMHGKRPA
jgi:hypothetical protein